MAVLPRVLPRSLLRVLLALAVLALWEIATRVLRIPAYILPPPTRIAAAQPFYLLCHKSAGNSPPSRPLMVDVL